MRMKTKVTPIVCAAVLSMTGWTTLGQGNSSKSVPGTVRERAAAAAESARAAGKEDSLAAQLETLGRTARASDLLGMTVKNYAEEKLGTVHNIGIDVEAGRIIQVILSTGGMLGVGDKLVAVPPTALYCDPLNQAVYLNIDKEKLAAAPKFDMARWEELSRPDQVAGVYRYFGDEPFFSTEPAAEAKPVPSRTETSKSRATPPAPKQESKAPAPPARWQLGSVQPATKVKGMTVRNLQDEVLGKVNDIVMDLPSTRIVGIIVSSGGLAGIGGELNAVPPTAFRYDFKKHELQLDASKDLFAKAPHFKPSEWPDMNQPSYASEFHRAYGVEPYFYSNPMTGLVNTSQNTRDRGGRTLMPFDQGNSAADRDRTAQIRRAIVGRKGLSSDARNIKIITRDGSVTLRGPVSNAEEKRIVEQIAADIAQRDNVNSLLEAN
jgi:sporulation protein YlmC with PRC-barrel domain